jgi:glucose/arabinose dehydrogenase
MRKNRLESLILVALSLASLAACGGDLRVTEFPGPSEPVADVLGAASVTSTTITQEPSSILPSHSGTSTVALPSSTTSPPAPSISPVSEPTLQSAPPTGTVTPLAETPTGTAPAPTQTPTRVATVTSKPEPSPSAASTSSLGNDPANVRLELQPIVGGLDTPVGISNAADGSGRLFVVEKVGRIRVVGNGVLAESAFLDITDRVGASASEQGLLGLAFHPDYVSNGSLFVNYTNQQGNTVIARFSVSSDAARADPSSEEILLTIAQPAGNHNGGHLAFGPDGHLYAGLGDGGGAGDQFGNGQNGSTLLGAMLRLGVDSGLPYTVPAGNPFVGEPVVRDEIWAVGLRNPWRFSFDRVTGDLYIADVGQNQYEEVDFQPAGSAGGQNYGWPIMEGVHCFPEDRVCDQAGFALPVVEYDHSQGCSVTGGYVYRGQEFPLLKGIYVYGDYCSGRIWGLARSGGGSWRTAQLARADISLSSFGEDEVGELYLVDMGQGELFRLMARPR